MTLALPIRYKTINFILSMLSAFLILLSFSYSDSYVNNSEILQKQFSPSGSIESLIDDYDGIYYLVQLDLKNDSLYNIANNILPDAELFNGPASYHRVMSINHWQAISQGLSQDYITILNDSYRIPNMSRSFWVEVHEGGETEGTYTEDEAIEYTCSCLEGANDCVKLGWDDGWYNPFDYYGEAWYAYAPPAYQSIDEIRVTVIGGQCDALPTWSETYMGMRNDSGNWNQDYELSVDYTNNVYVVSEIWSNGMLMPQIGSEDNYVIDKVKLEFFYTCNAPENSPYNILADDQQSCTEINVSWQLSSSNATSQNLYRDGELIASLNLDATSYVDYFAVPSSEHLYCIEAINECGTSSQSCNPGSLLNPPESTDNVSATDGSYDNQVIVTWNQNYDAESYKIYRDNIWLGVNNSNNDTEYIDYIADIGTVYNYCIESINSCGQSALECDTGFSDIGQGDVNADGEINVLDIVLTVNVILEIEPITEYISYSADLNNDGNIDVLDIVLIINVILN